MKTEICFKDEALKKILTGVHKLAEAVGSTLGPGGRNVIYEQYGWPYVTKDGVTVARSINLVDKHEAIGAQMVKDVASKTCDNAGDGTTTATVLADGILKAGAKALSTGINPIDLQRGIDSAVTNIIDYINSNIKVNINDNEKVIKEIATLSANWDENIGGVVAEAISKVGIDGTVQVVDPKTGGIETTLKLIRGIKFDRGYTSPYYITDDAKQCVDFKDPYILLVNGSIDKASQIMEIIRQANKNNANLVIIADDYSAEVTQTLVLNKVRGKLNIATIKAPWYRDMRTSTMEDLAVYFNTRYFNIAHDDFDSISLKDMGRCEKCLVTATNTTFMEGAGSKTDIAERIEMLKSLKSNDDIDDTMKGNLDIRIKQLCACVAIINIGARTEVESQEKMDRIDDALSATRAAVKEGIVPGGVYAYLKAVNSNDFKKYMSQFTVSDARFIGANIIKSAVTDLFKKLLINAGLEDDAGVIMKQIIKSKKKNYGYDVKNRKMCDLRAAGIVDPWLVCKQALLNASSVSGLILTSDAVITQIPEEVKASQTPEIPSLL